MSLPVESAMPETKNGQLLLFLPLVVFLLIIGGGSTLLPPARSPGEAPATPFPPPLPGRRSLYSSINLAPRSEMSMAAAMPSEDLVEASVSGGAATEDSFMDAKDKGPVTPSGPNETTLIPVPPAPYNY